MTSQKPKITVHTKTKSTEEIVVMNPIEAYKAGYMDATKQLLNAATQFVTTLRITGWKDEDILKALLAALRNYTNGQGVADTSTDVERVFSGKGVKSGSKSKTEKL